MNLSPAKQAALETARAARAIAAARNTPEGYRSLDHFLDTVRERCGRRYGGTADLAQYLNVDESSVRRWIKGQKRPLQKTIDAMAVWLLRK